MVAPVATSASVSWASKSAWLASHTCAAPWLRSSAACSGLRTMFTSAMPSFRQMRLSIWPRFDAAAVCTSALWPSRFIVSVMPSAVSGLTKHEAPCTAVAPAGSGRQASTFTARYCAYIAPPMAATVRPSSACAAGDDPAATTVPAPSLPAGSDCPTRPAMAFISAGGTWARTTGRSAAPVTRAVDMSAAPNSSPMSDGLIGVASTRISTSSAAGCGTGTSCSDISSTPSALIRVRSWGAVAGRVMVVSRGVGW